MVLFANLLLLNACSDLFSDLTKISLRPTYMDLDGVTSFVVVDNTSVTKTKSTASRAIITPQIILRVIFFFLLIMLPPSIEQKTPITYQSYGRIVILI